MPEQDLYSRFRYERVSALRKVVEKGKNAIKYPFLKAKRALRSQRYLNEAYHSKLKNK